LIFRWFNQLKDRVMKSPAKTADIAAPVTTAKGPKKSHAGHTPHTDGEDKHPRKRRRNRNRKRGPKHDQAPQADHANWDLSQFQIPEAQDKTRFHDLDLSDQLMHAIQDAGFEYCSPIQAQILPQTLQGHDAIGKAQTGTGKTAAFLITIIDGMQKKPLADERRGREPRGLIVAPTRELVAQIADDARLLCKYTDFSIVSLIGGADYEKQKNAINNRPVDIVVATPGRLIDFMTRKDLFLDKAEFLVLDEADRMLDMGFIPQVRRIVRATPATEKRQTQLFSATFSHDIMNLSYQWTNKPVMVEIEPESVATDTVEQKVYMVSSDEKLKVLLNLLRSTEVGQVIVFANRRSTTQYLFKKIKNAGINVGILSGEIQQQKRTRTLEDFKQGKIKVVVATDVMGRGIHIEGISHVINFDLPEDPEDYVHRIGRTGRAGASGISISLACEQGSFQLPVIEALLGNKLKCELPPEELTA